MWRRALLGGVALVAVLGGGAAWAAPVEVGYVEVGYHDPVTALPGVSRPEVRHCAVTVMRHDFANSYGQPFVGTVSPPAGCAGPWSKVVLDWSGSVAGRQYDRLAGVWLGGAEVFRTSTPEPDPDGINWHVDTDISAFAPLLRSPQPLVVDLGNIVNETYTGVYHMTMTFTYYQADRRHPPARTADAVVPLAASTAAPGWYTLGAGQSATAEVTLPRNTEAVRAQVYARGGGCEEQWFGDVPNEVAAKYPDTLCGGGAYREVQVLVDGTPAGLAEPFPVIYTGGISPLMWRPIPSVDAFRTQPYEVDLTPFAGRFADGLPHAVTLVPYGNADNWTVGGQLFVDTDRGSGQTTGGLLADTVTTTPATATTTTDVTGGVRITQVTHREWTVAGWVRTSHGRVTTRVDGHWDVRNDDTVTTNGTVQHLVQRAAGAVTVSSGRTAGRTAFSYPIAVDSTYVPGTAPDTFSVSGAVDVTRHLRVAELRGRHWHATGSTDDRVTADGVLARDHGTVVRADGHDAEHYVGTAGAGGCDDHLIRAAHGYVVTDTDRPCRR
jgi:Peptide N-acetyl-beta-D-glucosaminyl asparaginase amidase A